MALAVHAGGGMDAPDPVLMRKIVDDKASGGQPCHQEDIPGAAAVLAEPVCQIASKARRDPAPPDDMLQPRGPVGSRFRGQGAMAPARDIRGSP